MRMEVNLMFMKIKFNIFYLKIILFNQEFH